MSLAERLLIRQKKDLYNFFAIHLWSIIKSFIVFALLVLLIQFPTQVPFGYFWVYLLTGLGFLICDALGVKALIDLTKKFVKQILNFICEAYQGSIKKYFQMSSVNADKHKFFGKCLYWILACLGFMIPLIVILIKLTIIVSIFGFVFLLITVLGNEAFSLIVTHTFARVIPLSNDIVLYSFYFVAYILIYLVIDYRVRQTIGFLIFDEIIDDGRKRIEGLELIRTNGKISIFSKDKKYLAFDHVSSQLTIYTVNSKYIKRKQALEEWFKKRNEKRNNQASIQKNEEKKL